jgi:hypothetical protein
MTGLRRIRSTIARCAASRGLSWIDSISLRWAALCARRSIDRAARPNEAPRSVATVRGACSLRACSAWCMAELFL